MDTSLLHEKNTRFGPHVRVVARSCTGRSTLGVDLTKKNETESLFVVLNRPRISRCQEHNSTLSRIDTSTTKRKKKIDPSRILSARSSLKSNDPKPLTNAFRKAWSGEASYTTAASTFGRFERFGRRVISIVAFSNVNAIETSKGLVLIDTALAVTQPIVFRALPKGKPLTHLIYTHGHRDHAWFGPEFRKKSIECLEMTGQHTQVIAHRATSERFDRYRLTSGYNGIINKRQFQSKKSGFSKKLMDELRYPDMTYDKTMKLSIHDEVDLVLHHVKGETDDCTIVHVPSEHCCFVGDVFIWSMPNVGNPQKVQRYPLEWCEALRFLVTLDCDMLFPGHGPPILGRERIRRACLETASFLEKLVKPCLRMINSGFTLNEIQHMTECPKWDPKTQIFLQQNYDDWRFVIVNVWRLYVVFECSSA